MKRIVTDELPQRAESGGIPVDGQSAMPPDRPRCAILRLLDIARSGARLFPGRLGNDPLTMRKLRTLCRALRRKWRDDPIALLQRLWRQNCSPAKRRVLIAIDSALTVVPDTRLAALVSLLLDDHSTLEDRLRLAMANGARGNKAKVLADIALVAHFPGLARSFANRLGSVPGTHQTIRTLAKLDFLAGDTTAAIERLDQSHPTLSRLREKYEAEREVFDQWVPSLASVGTYIPREKTVLHLLTNSLPHTNTGYTQRSQSLFRAQLDAGWSVHVATRIGYPETIGIFEPSSNQVIDGIHYHRLMPEGEMPNLRERLQEEAEKLQALVLKLRPRVLHTTTHFVNGLVARAVADSVGIPWVYEVRGQLADTWASKQGPGALKSERYRRFKAREVEIAQTADLVMTLGNAMRQRIVDAGVEPDKVLLSPNAVGSDFLNTPLPARAAKLLCKLDPDKFYIGTVSSLVAYEGLDDLMRAYALLRAQRDDVELMIVGDGAAMHELRTQATRLALDPDRIFVGRVPSSETPLRHQALDVFVVPRKDYDVTRSVTPLKPVEAMASCRPVVASDLPALCEMVTHGENGLTVSAESPEALAAAIGQLLDDSELRMRMGFAGRSMVLKTRTWERNAQTCIASYERLARHYVPPRRELESGQKRQADG